MAGSSYCVISMKLIMLLRMKRRFVLGCRFHGKNRLIRIMSFRLCWTNDTGYFSGKGG